MDAKKIDLLLGFSIVAGLAVLIAVFARSYWKLQVDVVSRLLTFAGVPHSVFTMGEAVDASRGIPLYYVPGGLTIKIPVVYQAVSPLVAIVVSLILIAIAFVLYRSNRIPLPAKVIFFTLAGLVIVTLMYVAFVSAVPPRLIHRLTVDWQFSGIIIFVLIGLVFAWSIFPVRGPLWIKLTWLGLALAFSVVWNTTRISVVLSTFYHLGSLPFVLTHYLTGIYIDFLYIVTFYSLAVAHLARRGVSELGW